MMEYVKNEKYFNKSMGSKYSLCSRSNDNARGNENCENVKILFKNMRELDSCQITKI